MGGRDSFTGKPSSLSYSNREMPRGLFLRSYVAPMTASMMNIITV